MKSQAERTSGPRRGAALRAAEEGLPRGFSLRREGGIWLLITPSGDCYVISMGRLPTERETAEAVALADHLHANVDYSRFRRAEGGAQDQPPVGPEQRTDVALGTAHRPKADGVQSASTSSRRRRLVGILAAMIVVVGYPKATFQPLPNSGDTDRLAAYCTGEIQAEAQGWSRGCNDSDPEVDRVCAEVSDQMRQSLGNDLRAYRNYLGRKGFLQGAVWSPASRQLERVSLLGAQDFNACAAASDICHCPDLDWAHICWRRCNEAQAACDMTSLCAQPDRLPEGSQ